MHMRSSYLFSVAICCFRVRCQLNLQSHHNSRKMTESIMHIIDPYLCPQLPVRCWSISSFPTLWAPLMDTIPSQILYGWQHIIRSIFNHMIVDENYWRLHKMNEIYLINAYLLWKFGYKRRLAKFLRKSRINPFAQLLTSGTRTKF